MTDAERTRFRVGKSGPGKGNGLFARVPIRKGEFVIEYTGNIISTVVADTLSTRYLFDLEDGRTIDGSPRTNTARWINHSCKPNCEAFLEDGHINIYAERSIAAGDELSFDYGQEYFDEFFAQSGCLCSAPRHRSSPKK
jgi:SET domain-containing protein